MRRECSIRGLNYRAPRSSLVICPMCGRARTRKTRHGVCRVCTVRIATRRTKTMIALELAATTPEFRRSHSHLLEPVEARANPRMRPLMPRTAGMRPDERQRAVDEHDAAVERAELEEAMNEYAAVRMRLHRLRAALRSDR